MDDNLDFDPHDNSISKEEKDRRVKVLMKERKEAAFARKVVKLFTTGIWFLCSLVFTVTVVKRWIPESDWTTAIKWVVLVSLVYNLIWCLCDFIQRLALFKYDEERY
jgi:hypothetical protein